MTTEPKPVKAWAIVVRETGEIYDGGSSYMPIRLKRLGSLSHSRLKYVRVLITPIGPTPKPKAPKPRSNVERAIEQAKQQYRERTALKWRIRTIGTTQVTLKKGKRKLSAIFGSVCPARLDDDREFLTLPHEPAMYNSQEFLIPIDPAVLSSVILKVCKHCGSVYGEALQADGRTNTACL